MAILLLIGGLLLFIGLVVAHEFGHFIMAKRGGVTVEEFGIGFPPRLWGRKTKGNWDFTLNALPLGGFVRLKGEHDADTSKGSFGAAPLSTKVKIMVAGVAMNLFIAYILLVVVNVMGTPLLVCGQYTVPSDTHVVRDNRALQVDQVEANSPAALAGLQKGDKIIKTGVSEQSLSRVSTACPFSDITHANAGKPLVMQYERDGKQFTTTATILTSEQVQANAAKGQNTGYLGVVPVSSGYVVVRSTWSAPVAAAVQIKQFTVLTLKGIGSILAGIGKAFVGLITGNTSERKAGQAQTTEQVSGPIGVFYILKAGAHEGVAMTLFIVAIISLTLAIMNILPIPALDGGRLFVTLLYRGLKKPLTKKAEDRIHGTGFAVLLLLMVLISIVDIKRFF